MPESLEPIFDPLGRATFFFIMIQDRQVPVFQPGTLMLESLSTDNIILSQNGANYLLDFLQFISSSSDLLAVSIENALSQHPDHLGILSLLSPYLDLNYPFLASTPLRKEQIDQIRSCLLVSDIVPSA